MRLTFAELSLATLKRIVQLNKRGVVPDIWDQMQAPVTPREQQQLQMVTAYLLNYQLNLMNEATIWSRAIYPLLLLAETGPIQAWAQVPLRASYPQFTFQYSREYAERLEAATVLHILKYIVQHASGYVYEPHQAAA